MSETETEGEEDVDVELLEELAEAPGTSEVMKAYGSKSGYSYQESVTNLSLARKGERKSILGRYSE